MVRTHPGALYYNSLTRDPLDRDQIAAVNQWRIAKLNQSPLRGINAGTMMAQAAI
jgi:hypothetical protein